MPQCVYANFVVGFNGFKSLLKEENVKMVWSTALKRPSVLVSYQTDRRTRQLELRLRSSIIAQFQRIAKHRAFDIKVKLSKIPKFLIFQENPKPQNQLFYFFKMTSKTQKKFFYFYFLNFQWKIYIFKFSKNFMVEKIFFNKERINNFL